MDKAWTGTDGGPAPEAQVGEVDRIAARYGLTPEEAAVSIERRRVYGDPLVNHIGISQGIAGILQPWALHIALMRPLPPHVIAMILGGLKFNRKRMVFHEDNYVDGRVYDHFAETWQREWSRDPNAPQPHTITPPPVSGAKLDLVWRLPDGSFVRAIDADPVGLNPGELLGIAPSSR